MPIEFEELQKELSSNEGLRNQLADALSTNEELRGPISGRLKEKGFDLLDETGRNNLLNKHKEDIINREIPNKIKEVHDGYDNTMKELGFPRQQNEKSYNAVARVIKQLKEENETLKTSGGSKGDTEKLTAEFKRQKEEIENNAKTTIAEKERELDELRGKFQLTEKQSKLQEVFAPIRAKFKSDLPGYFKSHEQAVLNEVLGQTKLVDGNLVMVDSEGNVKKDRNFDVIKVEDYLTDKFKDVFKDERRPAGGAGGGDNDPNAGKDSGTWTAENFVMPSEVKTRAELMGYLSKNGIKPNTKSFNEIFSKHKDNLQVK